MPNSKKTKHAPAKKHPAPKPVAKRAPVKKHAAPKSAPKAAPAKKPAAAPKAAAPKAAVHAKASVHAKKAPHAKASAHAKASVPSKPTPAKHKPAKPAPAKHHPHPSPVPSAHKPAAKPVSKPAPAHKPEAKRHEPAKPAPAPTHKPAAKPAAPVAKAPAAKAQNKADALRARILERRSAKPIAFTLDEVREIAKVNVAQTGAKNGTDSKTAANRPRTAAEELEAKLKKAAQPSFVKAASLADILGFNPAKQTPATVLDVSQIEPKFQRYYKLLIELREHVATGLDTHTEQTLKRSSKDDAGDLSSYAQHMADAGTDTFDRDFALSLVSNEQEALAEIEAAIQRIKNGTYGVCELTGKPINKDRLLAVPFARFSVESQAEVEKTRRRSASRAGLFGEGEEGAKMDDDSGGGDE